MPIYSYRCSVCGTRFDQRQPVEKKDEAFCINCPSLASKIFIPSTNTYIPSHFRMTGNWTAPDTKEGWENVGTKNEQKSIPDSSFEAYCKRNKIE
jgi:putative FmdB family regulatory protein